MQNTNGGNEVGGIGMHYEQPKLEIQLLDETDVIRTSWDEDDNVGNLF